MALKETHNDGRAFITLDRITIRLRDRFVFENTSWHMRSDQHWAVIGPNGAGKSTLVKAISGDLPIVRGRAVYHFMEEGDQGSVSPDGMIARVSFDVERDFHKQTALGCSADNENGWMSVGESILEALPPDGMHANTETHLKGIARSLAMEHLLERRIDNLSSGEAKKLLIARALMKSPRLLILDEPFEGIDQRSRLELRRLIEQLMLGDMRVILVTHRFDEITANITRVLCVKDCQVILQGSCEEILGSERLHEIYGEEGSPAPNKVCDLRPGDDDEAGHPDVLVKMKNATVRYDDTLVLSDVNWTVRRGENWAILGPNGSGKSKLLDLITGDNVQGYANDIYLFGARKGSGESIWEIRAKLSLVSAEFQMRYQKGLSGYDVICSGFFDSVGLYEECTREQHHIADNCVKALGLGRIVHRRFDQLSHGQQRMVLLARAVVKSPLLLILDEPCDGLDLVNRRKILELIEFIGGQTKTNVIYVTHHENEIPECITHALVLGKGRVAAIGEKKEILARARDRQR